MVVHRQHRRVGADVRRRRARARVSARSRCRRTTTTAARVRATTCSAKASWPSICGPASGSGTTSSCTTASGTWIFRAPPILADITVNGRTIKALAQPTKQAFLYVLNRETGEPIWPIEERPVPKGDTPGEWYAPTQPFPTKPPAYDGQGLTIDDLIDFTPELRAEAVKLVSRYRLGPIFTPPSVSRAEGPIATLTMGAQAAASNWPGGSYDPETHTVFVASQTVGRHAGSHAASARTLRSAVLSRHGADRRAAHGRIGLGCRTRGATGVTRRRASRCRRARGGGGGALTVQGLPLIKPPYSRITAIDLDKGEFRWQVPFGATPDNIRNHPALKGLNLPPLGRQGNNSGTLVTKTLLVAGESTFGPTPSGAARRDAARVRQGDRQGSRRGLHAGAAERIADDLHDERQAVHRRRDQRRHLLRRAGGVQAAVGPSPLFRATGKSSRSLRRSTTGLLD